MSLDFAALFALASDASSTISNAASVYTSLKGAVDRETGEPPDAALQVRDLAVHLADAQVKLAKLETGLERAQRAWRTEQEIKDRKGNYVLAETAEGARVYRLKDDADTGEPSHEVCPNCYEQCQIRILQPRGTVLHCDDCGVDYRVEPAAQPRAVPRRRDPLDDIL